MQKVQGWAGESAASALRSSWFQEFVILTYWSVEESTEWVRFLTFIWSLPFQAQRWLSQGQASFKPLQLIENYSKRRIEPTRLGWIYTPPFVNVPREAHSHRFMHPHKPLTKVQRNNEGSLSFRFRRLHAWARKIQPRGLAQLRRNISACGMENFWEEMWYQQTWIVWWFSSCQKETFLSFYDSWNPNTFYRSYIVRILVFPKHFPILNYPTNANLLYSQPYPSPHLLNRNYVLFGFS